MKIWRRISMFMSGIMLSLLSTTAAWADADLKSIITNIMDNFQSVGQLIVAIAYVAGIALVIVGIFKLKQHRDNPQQVPMSTPITIIAVGVLLIFFPSIINPAGQSIFGGDKTLGGFTGEGITSITGGQ